MLGRRDENSESARNHCLPVIWGGVLEDSALDFSIPENWHPRENIHSFIYSPSTHCIKGTVLASGCHSHLFPGYGKSLQSPKSTRFHCNVPSLPSHHSSGSGIWLLSVFQSSSYGLYLLAKLCAQPGFDSGLKSLCILGSNKNHPSNHKGGWGECEL